MRNTNLGEVKEEIGAKFFSSASEINATYGTALTAASHIKSILAVLHAGDRLDNYHAEKAPDNNYPEMYCRITGCNYDGALLTCQAYSSAYNKLYYARCTSDGATGWEANILTSDLESKAVLKSISGSVFSKLSASSGDSGAYWEAALTNKDVIRIGMRPNGIVEIQRLHNGSWLTPIPLCTTWE